MMPLVPAFRLSSGIDGVESMNAIPARRAKLKEIVIRRKEYLVGVREAAARLGCTGANVSMVVRGVRKSRRLLERMRKLNIRVEGGVQ